jgi:membrane protease YdiL (CAAX protease family)
MVNEQQVRVPATGLRAAMQRHPIASYFALMYTGLTLSYLPAILSNHGFGILPFEFPFPLILFNLPASLFGALLAGVIMSWVVGGKEGRREFRKSLFRFRVGPQWYLFALVGVPVLGVLSVGAMLGISPIAQLVGNLGGFLGSYLFTTLAVALLINLWEESGQMAFVTPIVQRSHGPVFASVLVAVTWAFMHMPPLFITGFEVGFGFPVTFEGVALSVALMAVYALPVRFIATWLFNNARRSVVIVALFHAAMNAMQSELGKLSTAYNPFYLIGAFAVVSFVLIALTRGKLGYKGEAAPAPYRDDTLRSTAPVAQA